MTLWDSIGRNDCSVGTSYGSVTIQDMQKADEACVRNPSNERILNKPRLKSILVIYGPASGAAIREDTTNSGCTSIAEADILAPHYGPKRSMRLMLWLLCNSGA